MRRTRFKHVCLAALLTLAGLGGAGTLPDRKSVV